MKTIEIEWPVEGLRKINCFKYRDEEGTLFMGLCFFGLLIRVIARRKSV